MVYRNVEAPTKKLELSTLGILEGINTHNVNPFHLSLIRQTSWVNLKMSRYVTQHCMEKERSKMKSSPTKQNKTLH